MSCQKDNIK